MPVGAELARRWRVSFETSEGSGAVVRALGLASPALLAASAPAWRMAAVRGVSGFVEGGGLEGVVVVVGTGAWDGVVDAEVAGIILEGVEETEDAGAGPGAPMLSLSSPYSFHSSTSSRSCCSCFQYTTEQEPAL